MNIKYTDNAHLIIELKKTMLDSGMTQREIAEKLGIKPQGLTKILNKKNFSFDDVNKILNAMNYNLEINFQKNND